MPTIASHTRAAKYCLLLMLLLFGGVARANSCTLNIPQPYFLEFGEYLAGVGNPANGPNFNLDAQNSFSLNCTKSGLLNFTWQIFIGTGDESSVYVRKLRMDGDSPTQFLNYNVYVDAARTQIWNNNAVANAGTMFRTGICGPTCNVAIPVYGRIPGRQTARHGFYEDILLVTVNF